MNNDAYSIGLDDKDPTHVLLGKAFRSDSVPLAGATIHYVRGGQGPALVFVHGFSEDWYEFAPIMSRLAQKYTVVALDLRGIGHSIATKPEFDAETLARDVHELISVLALENPYIVGHDMGAMIAYAYARLFPLETLGIAVLDGPLPGTRSTDIMVKLPMFWHFTFHRIPKVPERLIKGREYTYFKRAFYQRFAKTEDAPSELVMRHYASAYTSRAQLTAALGLYRAYRKNRVFLKSHRETLDIPILILEGHYFSEKPGPTAKELRNTFHCKDVTAQVVSGCGHFMTDEQPDVIASLLRKHISKCLTNTASKKLAKT